MPTEALEVEAFAGGIGAHEDLDFPLADEAFEILTLGGFRHLPVEVLSHLYQRFAQKGTTPGVLSPLNLTPSKNLWDLGAGS